MDDETGRIEGLSITLAPGAPRIAVRNCLRVAW